MSLENILSQEIVQRLGWTLLHFVWQATAVAVVLAILLAGLRKAAPNVRYIISCLALGLMVLLPIVTMQLVPASRPQPIVNLEPPPIPTIAPVQPTEEMPLAAVVEYKEPAQLESTETAPMIPWKQRATEKLEASLPYLVSGWLIGVFGLSLWHLGGWAQLQRLRRKLTRPVDASLHAMLGQLAGKLGVGRAVGLLESALVQVPTVVGWLRPVILLPASALTGLTAEQLEALLAHELAHIRRYDYLVNMLQTVIETLGFYHPAVWWVSHKIRVERENCCDDMAVGLCGDRIRYARALTSMEEIRAGRSELAVAASGGNLFARIRRLLGKESSDSSQTGWIPSVITILLIAIIAIPTTLALTGQSEDKSKTNIETLVLDGFRENRDKFKCGVLAWSRTTINDGFGRSSEEKYQTKGSFQLWWDGKKVATKYVDERLCTDPTGRRWIEAQTGGNTYGGGLLSRKPKFGPYENWLEQVIRWQGSGSLDNLLLTLKKQEHVTISWSIVDVDGSEMFKLLARNMDETGTDYGAYAVEYYDPSKGYGLVNQEWYNSDGRPRMKHTVKLQQVIPHGWFPVEVDMKSFHPENDKVTLHNRLVLDLKRCSFNDPSAIPEGIFEFSAAKEHERLNDIVERLSQGTVADEADNRVKGPLESVDNYLTAALAGDDEKAAKYAYPESAVAAQTKDTRDILQGQDIKIIAASIGEWNTLAISSVIQTEHGRVGSVTFHLKKVVLDQEAHWLIDDIDLETLGTIEGEIERFIETNPDAKTIVVKTNVLSPGPSASKQPDSAGGDEPAEWRKQADTGADSNDAMLENGMGQIGEVGLGTVRKAKHITLDPKTKRLEREFGFERLLHKAGDVWELEKPYLNVYRPNFTCYITADKGQVQVETAVGRTTPQDVTFSSNVVIRMVAGGAGSVQESFLYLDNIVFLSDQSRFTTTGPARFVSENAQMRGTGLELIYNDQAERLEYFGIADLESLHIESTQAAAASTSADRPEPNAATVAGEGRARVRVELSVVETSSDVRIDRKTAVETENLLGGKISFSGSQTVADLLRKASEATAAVKDESAGDERVSQKEFDTLFDLLVSRGYVKILMNPTLEVVEGQTARIKTDQSSLEITVQGAENDAIDLQVQADLSAPVAADGNDQTPMFSRRSLSNRVRINSGQSLIIGGLVKPGFSTEPDRDAKGSEASAKEIMCIVTASITIPPTDAEQKETNAKEYEVIQLSHIDASEAAERITRVLSQLPEMELGKNVLLQPLERAKQVIIFGQPDKREMVKKLIAEIDIPSSLFETRVFRLKYADADEIKVRIEASYEYRTTELQERVRVISYPEMQQVTVIASPENLSRIAEQIAEWDVFQVFKPRIIKLQNSDPVQMARLLTALFAEEGGHDVNIRDVILGEDAQEKPDTAGPLSDHFIFEDVPGTNRIIVIGNIPDAYDVVVQLVLELDKQKMATRDVTQVRQWMARLVSKGQLRGPEDQTTISGRCLDSGRRPLSNARIQLLCRDSGQNGITPAAESRTDSEGRFRLGPITSPSEEDWGHKSYFLFAPADGHGPAWKEVNLYEETIEPIELTAYSSATVTGSVLTEDSRPVAGAQVWVRGIIPPEATTEETASRANRFFIHAPLPGWSTTTDSDGAFRITGVPDRARIQLFVSHRDFAGCIVHVKAGANAKIKVQPAAVITGRVLYGKTGRPAAGVVVATQGVKTIPIPGGWMATGGPAVTDEQGRYRLESLPGAKYNVYAKAENLTVVALDSFEVKAGEAREAPDLVLVEGGFIAGRVIDEATGQPVKPGQHSDVAIYGPSRPKSGAAVQSSRIREDGSFRIRVAPGRNYIYLRPMAEWGREKATANPPAHWVEVAQGQSVDVEFKIRELSQEESEAEARRRGRTISIINVPNTLDELENSAKRLKQLGLAIAMYANEHDDTLPDGLQPLEGYVQEQGLFRWLLENVEYLGEPRAEQPNAARVPIAYDRTLLQQDYSTEVLFLDFSVRLVRPPELRDLGIQLRIRRPTQTVPDEPMVTVDFRNVEIKTIVPKLAEWTGKVIIPTADLMKQKITIHAPQKVSRSKAVAMIYNALRSEGYAVEQTDETIFLKPMTGKQSDIGRAKIQIETRILEVTDDFLNENRLDVNSVLTDEIRTRHGHTLADSAAEPNSLTYCLIFDDLDVNLLLKAAAAHRDSKVLSAPQVLASDGRPVTMKIVTQELPVATPSDANDPSGKAQSKLHYVDVGTSIKITPDALPDTNNVLLDFEWELSQVRGFEQRIDPDGKKQKFPLIARDDIKTTAMIPDGKTLLIGGKKIRRWVVTRTKKPLLGDLPLIGSLFHSERKVEETRNILILIKPTLDLQKRAETRAASPGS